MERSPQNVSEIDDAKERFHRHVAGDRDWAPEQLYVALRIAHEDQIDPASADHYLTEPAGAWYSRLPVTESWRFLTPDEGVPGAGPIAGHDLRAVNCQKFTWTAEGLGDQETLSVSSMVLVDAPSGDCVVVASFGLCLPPRRPVFANAVTHCFESMVFGIRDPAKDLPYWVSSREPDANTRGHFNSAGQLWLAFRDEGMRNVLEHLTATNPLESGLSATPIHVVYDWDAVAGPVNVEVVEFGPATSLPLAYDDELLVIHAANTEALALPTNHAGGPIGLRMRSGGRLVCEMWYRAGLGSSGRFHAGLAAPKMAADGCRGAILLKDSVLPEIVGFPGFAGSPRRHSQIDFRLL